MCVFKIDFTENGRENSERETSVIEKHHWGSNLPPVYVPWLGTKPTIFWYMGQCSNQVSLGQARFNMPVQTLMTSQSDRKSLYSQRKK